MFCLKQIHWIIAKAATETDSRSLFVAEALQSDAFPSTPGASHRRCGDVIISRWNVDSQSMGISGS